MLKIQANFDRWALEAVDETPSSPLISAASKSVGFQDDAGPLRAKGEGVVFAFADTCPRQQE
jgi:hypothetical protein